MTSQRSRIGFALLPAGAGVQTQLFAADVAWPDSFVCEPTWTLGEADCSPLQLVVVDYVRPVPREGQRARVSLAEGASEEAAKHWVGLCTSLAHGLQGASEPKVGNPTFAEPMTDAAVAATFFGV
jgi:hypothetical protein